MFRDFDLSAFLYDLFLNWGFSESLSSFLRLIIIVLGIALISWLSNLIAKFVIDRIVSVFVRRTKFKWDDIFLDSHVFTRLSHFVPAVVIWLSVEWTFKEWPGWLDFFQTLTYIYMVLAGTLFLISFVNAWHAIYMRLPISQERHIKGYVQLVKILLVFIGILVTIAIISDQSVLKLLAGLGAMAAVLLLVFKDTILGFVASIQLAANHMVNIGDWITMPGRNVDGTILDITLNTVKVQNFDKTIMTIPTYALVQESFQNWKGMQDSGGRRIKRSINIDMKSVRFLDEEMKKRLMRIEILKDYMERKDAELTNYNKEQKIDESVLVNGRRMTNLGTFRAYLEAYLANNPKVNREMTFMVRQLQPTENGIPMEIYVFSKDQEWVKYESVQADIFDHLLAVVPEFGLRVFQNPTGDDFRGILKS